MEACPSKDKSSAKAKVYVLRIIAIITKVITFLRVTTFLKYTTTLYIIINRLYQKMLDFLSTINYFTKKEEILQIYRINKYNRYRRLSMISFSKKEQIIILLSVVLIVAGLGYKLLMKDNNNLENDISSTDELAFEPASDDIDNTEGIEDGALENSLIMVHVSGQVYTPGIIELVRGDRVIDAVNMAGGLTDDADLDRINLAKKVEDEEKIYIPKKGEELNDAQVDDLGYNSTDSESNNEKININKCSKEELESLPGIGNVIASRIIEYRSANLFKTIDDLRNVSGIGDKKFEGIKELITVK